jgi:hypothetical protein
VPGGAPRLGEHNKDVWCGVVGVDEVELAELEERGIV